MQLSAHQLNLYHARANSPPEDMHSFQRSFQHAAIGIQSRKTCLRPFVRILIQILTSSMAFFVDTSFNDNIYLECMYTSNTLVFGVWGYKCMACYVKGSDADCQRMHPCIRTASSSSMCDSTLLTASMSVSCIHTGQWQLLRASGCA